MSHTAIYFFGESAYKHFLSVKDLLLYYSQYFYSTSSLGTLFLKRFDSLSIGKISTQKFYSHYTIFQQNYAHVLAIRAYIFILVAKKIIPECMICLLQIVLFRKKVKKSPQYFLPVECTQGLWNS